MAGVEGTQVSFGAVQALEYLEERWAPDMGYAEIIRIISDYGL